MSVKILGGPGLHLHGGVGYRPAILARVQAYPLKKPANFVPHFLGSLHATVTALARTCITIAWNAFPTARIPKIRPQSRVRKFAYRKAHFKTHFYFSAARERRSAGGRAAAILRFSRSHLRVFP